MKENTFPFLKIKTRIVFFLFIFLIFFCSNFFPFLLYVYEMFCFFFFYSSLFYSLLYWFTILVEKVYYVVVLLYVFCVCVYFVYLSTVLSQKPKFPQYFFTNIFCSPSYINAAFVSYETIDVASFGQTSNRLLI